MPRNRYNKAQRARNRDRRRRKSPRVSKEWKEKLIRREQAKLKLLRLADENGNFPLRPPSTKYELPRWLRYPQGHNVRKYKFMPKRLRQGPLQAIRSDVLELTSVQKGDYVQYAINKQGDLAWWGGGSKKGLRFVTERVKQVWTAGRRRTYGDNPREDQPRGHKIVLASTHRFPHGIPIAMLFKMNFKSLTDADEVVERGL